MPCLYPTGYILEATKTSLSESVADTQPFLLPLCEVLEAIFRKGLNHTVHSAFGLTRRDYWSWVEKTTQVSAGYVDFMYSMDINVYLVYLLGERHVWAVWSWIERLAVTLLLTLKWLW